MLKFISSLPPLPPKAEHKPTFTGTRLQFLSFITGEDFTANQTDMKKKLPPPTDNLRELADHDVKFAALRKDGKYAPRKGKAGATHVVTVEPGSVLVAPKGKWKKHKTPDVPNGPRIPDEPVDSTPVGTVAKHPPIPKGATHLEYSNSRVAIVEDIRHLDNYVGMRGEIRFGKLHWGTDFISMMPGEEGMVGAANDQEVIIKRDAIKAKAKAAVTAATPAVPRETAPHIRKTAAGEREVQNGMTRPDPAGKTAKVWAILDAHLAASGEVLPRPTLLAEAAKQGCNLGMASTQYSYWKRFKGLNKQ